MTEDTELYIINTNYQDRHGNIYAAGDTIKLNAKTARKFASRLTLVPDLTTSEKRKLKPMKFNIRMDKLRGTLYNALEDYKAISKELYRKRKELTIEGPGKAEANEHKKWMEHMAGTLSDFRTEAEKLNDFFSDILKDKKDLNKKDLDKKDLDKRQPAITKKGNT